MVCSECAKKEEKLVTPEFTKSKLNMSLLSSSSSERKVNQNMMLNKRKFAFDPMSAKCILCKGRVENKNKYCLTCAYTKGLCERCGKKIVDTKMMKFTDVDVKDSKRKEKMSEKTKKISEKAHLKLQQKETNKGLKSLNILSKEENSKTAKEKPKENIKPVIKLDKLDDKKEIEKIANDVLEDILSDENEYDEVIKI